MEFDTSKSHPPQSPFKGGSCKSLQIAVSHSSFPHKVPHTMKTKEEIVQNWLPRYTGKKLEEFSQYILLTNFSGYVNMFAEWHNVEVEGKDRPMQSATADGITIINFSMGSAMAATIMDLLSAIDPKAVLFLGKCGGLKKKNQIGDFILPIAAIRGEGISEGIVSD